MTISFQITTSYCLISTNAENLQITSYNGKILSAIEHAQKLITLFFRCACRFNYHSLCDGKNYNYNFDTFYSHKNDVQKMNSLKNNNTMNTYYYNAIKQKHTF